MTDRFTLRQRLDTARLARFVGREIETETFRAALAGHEVALLYLHGPGGTGKSSLLDIFGRLALAAGHNVVRIDARDIDLSSSGVSRALEAVPPPATGSRLVLMLDTWERAAPIDDWLRETFLPALDVETFVVIASRNPPGPRWAEGRSWGPLLQVIGLRNFLPHETEAFLIARGTPSERHELLAEVSYGHPLALTLLCDLERQNAITGSLALRDRPDLVQALLGQCLDSISEREQRLALAICAHARTTTEALLRDAMELDDAYPLFDWLRGLSIVQEGPHGVFPHDLARDVIDADFRWRDLQGYIDMHARVRAPVLRRVRALSGLEQQQAANDLLFLHRNGPVLGNIVHWSSLGQGRIELATPADAPAVFEMVEQFEGPESAAIARYWWERMPTAFSVFRGAGNEIIGFDASLILSEPEAEAIVIDPAIAAIWRTIDAHAPLRSGEVVLYSRFHMDRDAYQGPSPGVNMMAMSSLLHWLTIPNLAWSFLANSDPDRWGQVFGYLDQQPFAEADFRVGPRRYAVYGHDWRALPADRWLDVMSQREIANGPPPRPMGSTPAVAQVLSRHDFEQAVRRALRELHDPPALERNPLSRSRLVLGVGESDTSITLQTRLLAAIDLLAHSPRDAKLYRAIDRTYLHPAVSQERAAEALGLPFNTYRYHLSGAIRRIVDELWRIELAP